MLQTRKCTTILFFRVFTLSVIEAILGKIMEGENGRQGEKVGGHEHSNEKGNKNSTFDITFFL